MESSVKPAVIGILALFICVHLAMADVGILPRCSWAGLYNFGDSNSDTGGISAAFTPVSSPYGMTFFKKPAGRLSDGRLVLDFLAEYIGLPYVSAYLDTINTDYRHGANFATGGSTIRRQNETIFKGGISPFSLDIQTVQFTQFKARIIDLWSSGHPAADKSQLQRPGDFSKALFTIDIGQNDLSVGFRTLSKQQLRPVGCLPVSTSNVRNPEPGYLDRYGCIRYQNDMAMEFNRQLKARVIKLRSELTEAAITYVDIYTAKYKLISSTKEYGFYEPLKVCCGHLEKNVRIFCGTTGIMNGTTVHGDACANPPVYVIWDGVHMTEAANRWVANQILNGSLSDPPIPATHACYKHL
ncbi:Lipase, GDSL [Cynara cardunculus var. scolymus]|uniref:Lipase, GDSL n=1 Tax=Cynara cardunculus var. scolymus TaxID=59895 RepID=A0A103YHI1_CYNCS|nr:Lipase, GDSL [Cynara cardunculus var. scolymus]